MKSKDDLRKILEKALVWEKSAEQNCDMILHILTTNGYHDMVERIKNDEKQHQEWVRQLIKFLDS